MNAHNAAESRRELPVLVDIAWWGIAGAGVALGAGRVGRWWGIEPLPLAIAGGALALSALGLWAWVHRGGPMRRPMVQVFGAANLALAPAVALVGLFHWLPLTLAGNEALATAAVILLALGTWQFTTARADRRSA